MTEAMTETEVETEPKKIRLLIVDDQSPVRQGLALLLGSEPDIEVVGDAANGAQACQMVDSLQPAVVLMDLRMPVMGGVEATAKILKAHPTTKIIVLTTFDDDEYLLGSLRAGASGYLLKDTPFEELAEAIRVVLTGKSLLSSEVMSKLVQTVQADQLKTTGSEAHKASNSSLSDLSNLPETIRKKLSEREHTVLALIGRGRTNAEIATELCLTEGTVKNHVTKILATIGAKSRLQAALLLQDGSGGSDLNS